MYRRATEGALKILAEKIGYEDDAKHRKAMNRRDKSSKDGAKEVCDEIMSNVEVLSTLEFDRNRKSMSVICREKMNNTKKSKNSNGGELPLEGYRSLFREARIF